MTGVTDLTLYQVVVAGSAIQDKQWLPEAMLFLQTHQAALARKPVATFLVCMTLAISDGKYRKQVSDFMQPVRLPVKPVSEGLFAGALDISKVPSLLKRLMFRLSVIFGVWSEGDHRDWNAIRAWANSICPLLLQQALRERFFNQPTCLHNTGIRWSVFTKPNRL